MMTKWGLVALLALEAHFAASYLVPLDEGSKQEFGGSLRWLWPWAYGDSGAAGSLVEGQDLPLAGLLLAQAAAVTFVLSAMAAAGLWVPTGWSRWLASSGALALLVLMALFFGPTKLLPGAVAIATLYVALIKPGMVGGSV